MKITIQKIVGDLGETWMIEVPVSSDVLRSRDPVVGIKAHTETALRVIDDRLLEMNLRILARNKIAQKLTPEALLALNQTIQIMYGIAADPSARRVMQDVREEAKDPKVEVTPPSDQDVTRQLEMALEATDEGGR